MPRPLILALALLFAGALPAQPVVSKISPQAGSAGDEITVTGTFSVCPTHLQFMATVGGALGVDVRIVPVTSVTMTRIKAPVPILAGFAPPSATPSGDPLGMVRVRDAGGLFSPWLPFYFYEGSYLDPAGLIRMLDTVGQGTTNSLGCRATAAFDLQGGAPNPATGAPGFQLTLENATPNSSSFLYLGLPAMSPAPFGDGFVGLDVTQSLIPVGFPIAPPVTDGNGEIAILAPLPAGILGLSTALGWAYVDSGNQQFQVSTCLILNL